VAVAISLPYDKTCPVIYDNDTHDDMYTDEYLLSLNSAGDIALKGMMTSSCGWPYPMYPNLAYDPNFVFFWSYSGRSELVSKAIRSGMQHCPTPVAGSAVALVKPASGVIADTAPVDTPGAHLIVTEAHNATPNKPLLVIMGCPPPPLASAYLMDPSISNLVVLGWMGGGPTENQLQNYNDTVDPWATQICLQRYRAVLFGVVFDQAALVDKTMLSDLPNTELRQWMIDNNLPQAGLPNGHDYNGPVGIAMMRPDYVVAAKSKSWGGVDGSGNMFLVDDPNGKITMVTTANQRVATTEWWRALGNLAAYGNHPVHPVLTPYNGTPFAIPGHIEAEQFDYGGPNWSYHNLKTKNMDEYLTHYPTTYRVTDSVDFDAVTNTSGYALALLEPGEWIDYSVNVATSGPCAVSIRVAGQGTGGAFHLEFNGVDQTGLLLVPDTGAGRIGRW